MNLEDSGNLKKSGKLCGIRHTEIKAGEEYEYNSKTLCEDCCISICTRRVRKTHWRYLGSIKTEYLIPSKSA
jgi:hypothetical protein